MKHPFEIGSLDQLLAALPDLRGQVVQHVDTTQASIDWAKAQLDDSAFLGCQFSKADRQTIRERGGLLFPPFSEKPYKPYRASLYTVNELMDGFHPEPGQDESPDKKIYDHFSTFHNNSTTPILECLAQRIHDHAIDDALEELLHTGNKKPVGIMGGHGTLRTDPYFRKVATISRALTRAGYFVVTGGGPGIMEAGNLGAWLAPHSDEALDAALHQLAEAPSYKDANYMCQAQAVVEQFPNGAESLAVPTWFYGHEPSNVFSPHIAKYFSNSLREDGLLALATYGVIYAPGSAGTLQEAFMDLCQNHYATFRYLSPMVFLGREFYTETTHTFPMLEQFTAGRNYADLLALFDEPNEVVDFIVQHPPRDTRA